MYYILLKSHSGLRYLLLFSFITTIYLLMKQRANKNVSLGLTITNSLFIIQFLIGIVLYFISSKVLISGEMFSSTLLRFFSMEHPLMMLISLSLCLFAGRANRKGKQKNVKLLYIFSFVVLLIAIPWPFRQQLAVMWF